MVDPETPETETAEDAAPSNAELDSRITALDGKLDTILDRLAGTKDKAHAAAEQHTEDRLDRPSNIADEIRQQLAAQRAAEEADADKRGQADRLAAVEQSLAGMAEHTPEAPVRRIEKIMGWH